MSPIKIPTVSGFLKDSADNFELLAPLFSGEDGLGARRTAMITFDTEGLDANGVANTTAVAHPQDVELPANAIIIGGFLDVNTAFGSADDTATIAISVEGANDIVSAAPVSGAPYSTIGRKAIIPKNNTPESTSVKTTVARKVTFTVGVQALEEGKATLYLDYVPGVASA